MAAPASNATASTSAAAAAAAPTVPAIAPSAKGNSQPTPRAFDSALNDLKTRVALIQSSRPVAQDELAEVLRIIEGFRPFLSKENEGVLLLVLLGAALAKIVASG